MSAADGKLVLTVTGNPALGGDTSDEQRRQLTEESLLASCRLLHKRHMDTLRHVLDRLTPHLVQSIQAADKLSDTARQVALDLLVVVSALSGFFAAEDVAAGRQPRGVAPGRCRALEAATNALSQCISTKEASSLWTAIKGWISVLSRSIRTLADGALAHDSATRCPQHRMEQINQLYDSIVHAALREKHVPDPAQWLEDKRAHWVASLQRIDGPFSSLDEFLEAEQKAEEVKRDDGGEPAGTKAAASRTSAAAPASSASPLPPLHPAPNWGQSKRRIIQSLAQADDAEFNTICLRLQLAPKVKGRHGRQSQAALADGEEKSSEQKGELLADAAAEHGEASAAAAAAAVGVRRQPVRQAASKSSAGQASLAAAAATAHVRGRSSRKAASKSSAGDASPAAAAASTAATDDGAAEQKSEDGAAAGDGAAAAAAAASLDSAEQVEEQNTLRVRSIRPLLLDRGATLPLPLPGDPAAPLHLRPEVQSQMDAAGTSTVHLSSATQRTIHTMLRTNCFHPRCVSDDVPIIRVPVSLSSSQSVSEISADASQHAAFGTSSASPAGAVVPDLFGPGDWTRGVDSATAGQLRPFGFQPAAGELLTVPSTCTFKGRTGPEIGFFRVDSTTQEGGTQREKEQSYLQTNHAAYLFPTLPNLPDWGLTLHHTSGTYTTRGLQLSFHHCDQHLLLFGCYRLLVFPPCDELFEYVADKWLGHHGDEKLRNAVQKHELSHFGRAVLLSDAVIIPSEAELETRGIKCFSMDLTPAAMKSLSGSIPFMLLHTSSAPQCYLRHLSAPPQSMARGRLANLLQQHLSMCTMGRIAERYPEVQLHRCGTPAQPDSAAWRRGHARASRVVLSSAHHDAALLSLVPCVPCVLCLPPTAGHDPAHRVEEARRRPRAVR